MIKISLKAARVNAGLSQKDVAKKIGVSNKTLSSWENGTNFPSVIQINLLCELYKVTYNDLKFLPDDSL